MKLIELLLESPLVRFGLKILTPKSKQLCEQEFTSGYSYRHLSLVLVQSYGQTIPKNPFLLARASAKHATLDTVDGPLVKEKASPSLQLKSSPKEQNPNRPDREEEEQTNWKTDFTSFKIRLTNTLYEFWVNPRLRTGLILLLLVAPLSKFFYLLFPREGFGLYLYNNGTYIIPNMIEGSHWYFYSVFYFFFSLSEFLTPFLTTLGIFFLFPKNYYPSYLCGIPAGYYLALLVDRATITSNEDFHSPLAFSFVLIAILFIVFLMYMSDKMLFKTNHRKRAIEARILGLINMPGMSWEDKEELLKKEAKDAIKADNELFNRAG